MQTEVWFSNFNWDGFLWHGNLGGTEIAQAVADYLQSTRELAVSSGSGNISAAEAVTRLEPQVRDKYPTWEHTEFIAPALRYFLDRAGA
ncbi:MAG: hypothetical protein JO076_16550 [Verrucomicrobia bacterium]|nr:hypothetical protein [Verrucomicrobiota bacterium]